MSAQITPNSNLHPLIIIGAGPAGLSAGTYAGRNLLRPLILTGGQIGGQLINMADIENYPGVPHISGPELAKTLAAQAEKWGSVLVPEIVTAIDLSARPFKIWTQTAPADSGEYSMLTATKIISLKPEAYLPVAAAIKTQEPTYLAESLIVATGARRLTLGLPDEDRLVGRGIGFCATCDGPLFRDKVVAVVGAGNAALEEILTLAPLVSEIHVIALDSTFSRSEKALQERVLTLPNVTFHWSSKIITLSGQNKLEQITLENQITHEQEKIDLSGLFIAIGTVPNSVVFTDQLEIGQGGGLVAEVCTPFALDLALAANQTSVPGVFVAGDVTAGIFKQIVTAGASGAAAARAAADFLATKTV